MFSADIQFLDFTTQDWVRLADLFRSPGSATRAGAARATSGGVIGVRQGDRIVKLVSTVRGRLSPPEAPSHGLVSAEALGRQHNATFALVLSGTALEQLSDRFGRRLSREQTFHGQLEAFVEAMRELETEGEVQLWPTPFADWPIPTERALSAALDLVCPDGKVVVLGAFDGGELHTALALRRRGPGFDCVMGPERLRRDMGLLSGDFSRDYRYLGAAAEARLGPVAVGCYAELSTFQRLSGAREAGSWATAVATRDVILTPVTRGIALPLGVDAGRAAFLFAKDLAARFGLLERVSQTPLAPALGRAYAFVEGDVRRYLGFDPWRLLSSWLRQGA